MCDLSDLSIRKRAVPVWEFFHWPSIHHRSMCFWAQVVKLVALLCSPHNDSQILTDWTEGLNSSAEPSALLNLQHNKDISEILTGFCGLKEERNSRSEGIAQHFPWRHPESMDRASIGIIHARGATEEAPPKVSTLSFSDTTDHVWSNTKTQTLASYAHRNTVQIYQRENGAALQVWLQSMDHWQARK